jgi:RNA polymerase sigma-70 factor (ECF subfamily)
VRRVRAILHQRGVRPDEIVDATQEVYVIAYRKRSRRNVEVPEAAWLAAIARNVAMKDAEKRRRRHRLAPTDSLDVEGAPDATANPEQVASARRDYRLLIGALRDERRIVFELHEVDGFTLEEIAAALEIPLGTAHTRLRLAREDLTEHVKRLKARRRGCAFGILPFGRGAWGYVNDLFDEAPAPGEHEEVLARILEQLFPETAREPHRQPSRSRLRGLRGGGAGFAMVGAIMTGSVQTHEHTSVRQTADVASEAARSSRAPAPTREGTEAHEVSPTPTSSSIEACPPSSPASSPTVARTRRPADLDVEELREVRLARDAARLGDVAALRALLKEHDRRFPPGRAKLGGAVGVLRDKLPAARN